MNKRRPSVDRVVQRRLRIVARSIGDDLQRIRADVAASQSAVASAAGIDRAHVTRIEAGTARPSFETLVALATAMGADVSVRLYPGRGPRITDRHQAPMIEGVVGELADVWRPHLEIYVVRPVRGFVDAAFERTDRPLIVTAEFESVLPRLEQTIRWANEKAAAIPSSDIVGPGPIPEVSKLLVIRSTEATRAIARQFEATLRTAYPARTRDAVDSLRTGSPWPGAAIIWIRIDGDTTELLDGPPRGVTLGR